MTKGEGLICAHILGSHVHTITVSGPRTHQRTTLGLTSTHKPFFWPHMYAQMTLDFLGAGARGSRGGFLT